MATDSASVRVNESVRLRVDVEELVSATDRLNESDAAIVTPFPATSPTVMVMLSDVET